MKANNLFKETIKNYLDNRAKSDSLFAIVYAKKNKNIDDCLMYIINQAKYGKIKSEVDVFNMAVHYYDEDDIKITKMQCQVVVCDNLKIQTINTDNNKPVIKMTPTPTPTQKPVKRKENKTPTDQLTLF